MEYKDQVVWLLTEILKAIKAQRPKKRNRRVQGDLWVRGKKLDRIDVATQEWEESQERLRRELEAERARKNNGGSAPSATTGNNYRRSAPADTKIPLTHPPVAAAGFNGSAGVKATLPVKNLDDESHVPIVDQKALDRKAWEVKHGVVNGEAAKVAEQLMAKSRRMMG